MLLTMLLPLARPPRLKTARECFCVQAEILESHRGCQGTTKTTLL